MFVRHSRARLASLLAALIGALALAVPAAAQPAPAGRILDRADLETWLDGYVPYAMAKADVVGAEVVVVKDGQVLLQKGYGYADAARRTPVDPATTLFRPGSVSKTFTWTAVMQQVEAGKLDLDRDINTYLDFRIPPHHGQPVTLRNLLTHTPGFEESLGDLLSTRADRLQPGLRQYLVDNMPRRVFAPGKVTAYSNYGATLAGYIVQRVSGEPYEQYVARHIFSPLGMTHASFAQPLPANLLPLMSKGYPDAGSKPGAFEMIDAPQAGGLTVSGAELAHFMIAHLQNGAFGSNRILKPQTAKMMHDTPWAILPAGSRNLLGFYETNRNGRRIIAHGGDTTMFHSEMHLLVDDGVGIYAVINTNPRGEGILAPLVAGFVDRYFPGPAPDGRVDPATAAAHARMMVGTYESSLRYANFLSLLKFVGQPTVVANDDGTISVSAFKGPSGVVQKWREIRPFVWRDTRGPDLLGAKVESGRVVMFSAGETAQSTMLTPVPWTRSSAWLLPATQAALAVMALTFLAWPATALARWRWNRPSTLTRREIRAWRGARVLSLASLLTVAAFAAGLMSMTSDYTLLSHRSDWVVFTLHALALVVFPAAMAVALWAAWLAWRRPGGWIGKAWAVVLAASCLIVLWTALAFHMIGFSGVY